MLIISDSCRAFDDSASRFILRAFLLLVVFFVSFFSDRFGRRRGFPGSISVEVPAARLASFASIASIHIGLVGRRFIFNFPATNLTMSALISVNLV